MAEILSADPEMADELKARCISSSHIGLDAVGEALMALNPLTRVLRLLAESVAVYPLLFERVTDRQTKCSLQMR